MMNRFFVALLLVTIFAIESSSAQQAKTRDFGLGISNLRTKAANFKPFVIGGEEVPAGQYPWQVALVFAEEPNNMDAQFCGGTLIAARWVLTAAHCVLDANASSVQVLQGTQDLTKGGKRIDVDRIFVHPNYSDLSIDYDAALLRLKNDVAGPFATLPTASIGPNVKAKVIGWGIKDLDGNRPEKLLQGDQVTISLDVCRGEMQKVLPGVPVTSRMLCAIFPPPKPEGGPCYGDSGGSLLVADRTGAYTVQGGIVSWGPGCSNELRVGVYGNVAELLPWINAVRSAPDDTEELAELLAGISLKQIAFNRTLAQARPFELKAYGSLKPYLLQYYSEDSLNKLKLSAQVLKLGANASDLASYAILFRIEFAPGLYLVEVAVTEADDYYFSNGAFYAGGTSDSVYIATDSSLRGWRPTVALLNGRPQFYIRSNVAFLGVPYGAKPNPEYRGPALRHPRLQMAKQ